MASRLKLEAVILFALVSAACELWSVRGKAALAAEPLDLAGEFFSIVLVLSGWDVSGGCVVGGRRVLRAVARRLRGGCGVARAAEG